MNSLIVQKFGGTSVATPDIIKNTAHHVAKAYHQGQQVVVVVSAMAGVTDQLIDYVRQVAIAPDLREYDVVVSTGEQITCGLMALVLKNMGIPAQSWLGWQLPVITTKSHAKGRIEVIHHDRLRQSLDQGLVPIVAGFQGMTETKAVTTLGRGGSDLTAVALAASLNAERCDLYKDVDGIYTADPKIVVNAQKLNAISYEEMLELSSSGSKILQTRAVEMAIAHNVRLRVTPTFGNSRGTIIVGEHEIMEKGLIRGIVCNRGEAQISLDHVNNFSHAAAALFDCLAMAHIHVDMIDYVINPSDSNSCTLSFTLPRSEREQAVALITHHSNFIKFGSIGYQDRIAKISIVGIGLRNHAHYAHILFKTLADRNIPLHGISTSEIKMSILIDEAYAELATRALHTAYGLDEERLYDECA